MVTTEIELKRSSGLMALLLVMGLLAAVAISLADLPGLIQLVLAVSLLGALIWALWQWRRPLPNLRIKADGQIQLNAVNGDWQHVEIMPGSFVSPGLSVVRLRAQASTYHLVLLPDSATPDELRRLRLSLRWAPRTHSDTAFPGAG